MIEADHGQFYVQDVELYDAWMNDATDDPELPPAGWTEEAVQIHRIALEPHSISVGTARADVVESLATAHLSAPNTDQTAEHIVEADLDAQSGILGISSPSVLPADGPSLIVPAGLLRVRVSYVPSEPPNTALKGSLGSHFLYQIDVWPTARAQPLVVLRQGTTPWAE